MVAHRACENVTELRGRRLLPKLDQKVADGRPDEAGLEQPGEKDDRSDPDDGQGDPVEQNGMHDRLRQVVTRERNGKRAGGGRATGERYGPEHGGLRLARVARVRSLHECRRGGIVLPFSPLASKG